MSVALFAILSLLAVAITAFLEIWYIDRKRKNREDE